MRTLVAWIADRRVGTFTEDPQPDGSSLFAFEYDAPTETDIVSLTMVPEPGELRFETRSFPAPFDMILPEGDRRVRIEEARKILRTDPFSLLSYVGPNPVNRVRFLPQAEMPRYEPPLLPTPAEIAAHTRGRELFRDLIEELDLRQGIAGVQPKVLGAAEGFAGRKLSPDLRQFRGSTHILKASTTRFPFLAVNEQACLHVFEAARLAVPKATLSADGELLLVERFDLRDKGSCLGFEEAAALMGETSATKYQRDYGSMIESLVEFTGPHADNSVRAALVKALILNHLIGNGEAHLKNFGVVYEDPLRVSLAPFYDCVSTLPYIPDDVPALALSFEWYAKSWWPRKKIEEFALEYGRLSSSEVAEAIDESRAAVAQGIDVVLRYGRDITKFGGLAKEMAKLWQQRSSAFATEESALKRRRTLRQ